jgi:hypothetical protein
VFKPTNEITASSHLGQKRQLQPRIRLDQIDQILRPQAPQQVPDITGHERIVHDRPLIVPQDLLRRVHLPALVCVHEVRHRLDLRVGFVGLRLLRVEGVDLATGEHVGKDEILEDLDALEGAGFVVVLERFEKVAVGTFPLTCTK